MTSTVRRAASLVSGSGPERAWYLRRDRDCGRDHDCGHDHARGHENDCPV